MIIEAYVWLVIARLAVFLPFRLLARVLESPSLRVSESPGDIGRVSRAIAAAASHLPFRCECLEQSIAAKLMLRVRGIPNTLFLGFAKPALSHAWVRSGNDVVTGGDDIVRFAVIASFADVSDDSSRHADRVQA